MRTALIGVFTVLLACGGGSSSEPAKPLPATGSTGAAAEPSPELSDRASKCSRFLERSRRVLEEMAAGAGKSFDDKHGIELHGKCVESAETASSDEILIDCVIAAADDASVKTCWGDAMQRYIEKSKQASEASAP